MHLSPQFIAWCDVICDVCSTIAATMSILIYCHIKWGRVRATVEQVVARTVEDLERANAPTERIQKTTIEADQTIKVTPFEAPDLPPLKESEK
jgi:hypothetical protein